MSNRTKSAGQRVLGAVVLGVLAFGAKQAVAEPTAFTCQDDGWNFLGQQPTFEACLNECLVLHPDLEQARLSPVFCCTCLF